LWLSHDGASSSAGPRPHHHSGVSTRMTLFGLVRHGQTDYNRQHLFQGSSDIPLNDTGREQAHQALATATPVAWDAVITSPLARAQETGRVIASDHSLSFEGTDPRLVEIGWDRPRAAASPRWRRATPVVASPAARTSTRWSTAPAQRWTSSP